MAANHQPIVEHAPLPVPVNGTSSLSQEAFGSGQSVSPVRADSTDDPVRRFLVLSLPSQERESGTVPTEEEFLHLNQRRGELIHKKFSEGGITSAEAEELERVTAPVLAYVNFHFPPPATSLDYLKELARQAGIKMDLPEEM